MDIIKLLKLVGQIATVVGTASGFLLKPKLEAAKDQHMQKLVEEAVANVMKDKGL